MNYAFAPLLRKHDPPSAKPYNEYRSCLRFEFSYRCAYCLAHEAEVGPTSAFGRFEIDHLRPHGLLQFKHLKNVYNNLYWACYECNRAKSRRWPSADEEALGFRFVDPCVDSPADHLKVVDDEVQSLTAAGQYTVRYVNLNSPIHKHRRQDRKKRALRLHALARYAENLKSKASAIVAETDPVKARRAEELRSELDAVHQEYKKLEAEARALLAEPWDALKSCICPPKPPSAATSPAV